ncbi:MAG: radical SAM protein [Azoarcus sp.]|jgi:MoaA/NifB/PqqE/SkfB family radical SAM enzyme|nr:radical SAM protein [Azoarcus sp.]
MIVVWRITQHCNLTCPFCEWDRSLSRKRSWICAEQVLHFCRILRDHQQTTNDRVLLSWLGGEPLLWPHLCDLAAIVRKMGIAQSATTNGTSLASPNMQKQILDNFSELTVSVDGFAEFHDTMRGWYGGWERIKEAVMDLAARREDQNPLKLRANVVLMRDNLPDFPDLCSELAAWGFDEITFNALGGRDRPEFFPAHSLRSEDALALVKLLPALRVRLAQKGVRLCGSADYLARISATANRERLAVANCAAGESFLFIDETGRISPCNFTTSAYGVPVESIKCIQDFTKLPAYFARRRLEMPDATCEDCPSTQVFSKFAT